MKKKIVLIMSVMLVAVVSLVSLVSCGKQKFGAQIGTTSAEQIDKIKGTKLAAYDSFYNALQELDNGKLEGVVIDSATFGQLSKQDGFNNKFKKISVPVVENEKYAYAFNKGNNVLKDKVNAWLKENEKFIKDTVLEGMSNFSNLKEVEIKKVDNLKNIDDKTFVVISETTFDPWEKNVGTNKYKGIDMTIAEKMFNDFKAEGLYDKMVILDVDFDSVLLNLNEGKGVTNAIAMAGLSITEERKEKYTFSTEYAEVEINLVVNKNNVKYDNAKTTEELLKLMGKKK